MVQFSWSMLKGTPSALITSTQASAARVNAARRALTTPVPPPPLSSTLSNSVDWLRVLNDFGPHPSIGRLSHLVSLRRLDAAVSISVDNIAATLRDELINLSREAIAEQQDAQNDFLTKTANFLEWGAQKLPELPEMDLSDFVLARTVTEINRLAVGHEMMWVSHKRSSPIHPITRDTANEKIDQRARVARAALPLLKKSGMRLSEVI